jgi:hypothetical protein
VLFAKLANLINDYCLLAQARKVYGPYERKDGRKIVIIRENDGSHRTVSYPKFLFEERFGRKLSPDKETIDHLNFDKSDNRLENLRIVPRDLHSADDTRRVVLIKLHCDNCDKEFSRSPRVIRDKATKGARGIFCSKSCAAAYSRAVQSGKKKQLPKVKPIDSEYYRRKNIAEMIDLFLSKLG